MAKYRKKPIIIDAEPFTLGMEDGYACYRIDLSNSTNSTGFVGFFHKDSAIPRSSRVPAIQTLEGWYEVEEGKHYIVTGIEGERYPVETKIFHKTYDLIEG